MTDYSELVERMRAYPANRLCAQVANALEAQAKEIAEKDARISSWEQDNEVLGQLLSAKVKDNEKLRERIAELEMLVRSAYAEAWFDMVNPRQHPQQSATQFEKDWMTSLAYAMLKGDKSEQP